MHQIFLNYRIADSGDLVGRLQDGLSQVFGSDTVFWDKSALQGGDVWPERLKDQAAGCRVMLVVIGRGWQSTLHEPGHELGHLHRLHGENDWVKLEIQTAFRANRRVIPILASDAKMPGRRWLRQFGLEALAGQQGMPLRTGADYELDFARLVKRLKDCGVTPEVRRLVSAAPPPPVSVVSLPPPPPAVGLTPTSRSRSSRLSGRTAGRWWHWSAAAAASVLVMVSVMDKTATSRSSATPPPPVDPGRPPHDVDAQVVDAAVESPRMPKPTLTGGRSDPGGMRYGSGERVKQSTPALHQNARSSKVSSPRSEVPGEKVPAAGSESVDQTQRLSGSRAPIDLVDDEGRVPAVFGDGTRFADDEGLTPQLFGDSADFEDDEGSSPKVFGGSDDFADDEGRVPDVFGEPRREADE